MKTARMAASSLGPSKLTQILALTAIYVVAGKIGLSLAFLNASATPVWYCTGIALASLVLFGYQLWPAILIGAFLVNLSTNASPLTALIIAGGNTLEALAGAWFLNRFANGVRAFERPRTIMTFIGLSGMLSTAVSATVGVTSLAAAGFVRSEPYGAVWLTWWLGNLVSNVLVAPLILIWSQEVLIPPRPIRVVEAGFLLALLAATLGLVFGEWLVYPGHYPIGFFGFIPVIWAAYRFRQAGVVTIVALVSAAATWVTIAGRGPFASLSTNEALLLLQMYLACLTLTGLVLAAVVSQRQRTAQALEASEARSRLLAETVPSMIWVAAPDGTIVYANDRWYRYTGLTTDGSMEGWRRVIHPDDASRCLKLWHYALARGTDFEAEMRNRRADGHYRWFLTRAVPTRSAQGAIIEWFGVTTDIHDLKVAHEALGASLREKDVLLNEVHHRVKNNLQIISSLLSLQADQVRDPATLSLLADSRNRIRSMALVHERLYASKDVSKVDMGKYIEGLVNELSRTYNRPDIAVRTNVEPIALPIDAAIPCGLLLTELVSNGLKHAFPNGRSGSVWVALSRPARAGVALIVGDDGIGLPPDLDPEHCDGLGLRLVQTLAQQLGGELTIVRERGTIYTLRLSPGVARSPLMENAVSR
jgi:PAS domain S-box-containing protein